MYDILALLLLLLLACATDGAEEEEEEEGVLSTEMAAIISRDSDANFLCLI